MNQVTKFSFFCLFGFAALTTSAQKVQYQYSRPLTGVKDKWHSIVLPDSVYGKIQPSFADMRVLGIRDKDTLEAPYILRGVDEQPMFKVVSDDATIINRSRNTRGSFFTLEVPENRTLNSIFLDFKQADFDWKITLEGSHDQKEWFTVLSNYRILSIHNDRADYAYSTLVFPDSKYRYYRLLVPNDQTTSLVSASYWQQKNQQQKLKQYPLVVSGTTEDKQTRQTIIHLALATPVPVNLLNIFVHNTYDYFRPVRVEYLADSFKTEQGWKYNYAELYTGTLNSVDGNALRFNTTILSRLRITIVNHDNKALTIDSFAAKGPQFELVTRFDEPADYFFVYGNRDAAAPVYDISRFTTNIPENPVVLSIGDETSLAQQEQEKTSPLFENKLWLWLVMGLVIVVIGWFSLSMIKKI
jgi:hypothetical protein